MDPVSLVVAALIVGASKSVEGVAEDSLKSTYEQLKRLVGKFFVKEPAAKDVLDKLDRNGSRPENYKPLLEDYVKGSGAAQEDTILELAQKLLGLANLEGTRHEQYNIVGGIHADRGGIAAARVNNITMNGYHTPGGNPDPR